MHEPSLKTDPDRPIPPGSTIGIMGSGQLGRMTALAAARLGYRCHVFSPEANSPAEQVATATVAPYSDAEALERFAAAVDVVTFEFENVPHDCVKLLSRRICVRPSWECLHISQDRLREKDFMAAIGIPTTAYEKVTGADALARAAANLDRPAVLKTTRLGYDGKGQVLVGENTDPQAAWAEMGGDEGILESFVDFEREISVIVARTPDGQLAAFDPVENRHVDHILDITIAPAPISPALADDAVDIAGRIAQSMDLVGLLAVELFVTRQGELLVNEIAPRPHNSGHWTIDACVTSQFEQFVRAICSLPLGSTERHSDAVMKNLIGADIEGWPDLFSAAGAKLHLYGKAETRSGRKMGHVTRLFPKGSGPAARLGTPITEA
jgi:5-(carboxyamino)imidazole ribonucleotide synthase